MDIEDIRGAHSMRGIAKCEYDSKRVDWLISEHDRLTAELSNRCTPTIADHCSLSLRRSPVHYLRCAVSLRFCRCSDHIRALSLKEAK